MTLEDDITLNRLANGSIPIQTGIDWFLSLEDDRKQQVFNSLSAMCIQSHPLKSEIEAALGVQPKSNHLSNLQEILANEDLRRATASFRRLPIVFYGATFRLLISLLGIAGKRRKEISCKGACNHWWHWDLEDPKVISKIIDLRQQGKL